MVEIINMQPGPFEAITVQGLMSSGLDERMSEEIIKAIDDSIKRYSDTRLPEIIKNISIKQASYSFEHATEIGLLKAKMELKGDISQAKSDLNDKIAKVESRLKDKIIQVETELKGEIAQVDTGLRKEISKVREEIVQVESRLKEDISRLEVSINKEISSSQNTTIKWIVSLFFAQMIAIVGAIKYFVQ